MIMIIITMGIVVNFIFDFRLYPSKTIFTELVTIMFSYVYTSLLICVFRVLANYIVWSVIQDEVPYLSGRFLEARMHYKEKILGSKGLRKRWKTCVSYTNEYLGEILGALYIKQRPDKKYKGIVSAVCQLYNSLNLEFVVRFIELGI